MAYIEQKKFKEININDSFFDTLKNDYIEFVHWYQRKSDEEKKALVLYDGNNILAFLYMKIEKGIIDDVIPILEAKKRLKVGTFKVEAHGTKVGERFIKRIFDTAIASNIDEIYLTIFQKHESLIYIFKKFGFYKVAEKTTENGTEIVLIKNIKEIKNNILKDYPTVNLDNKSIYGLSIHPSFHTRLFSDSILNNESVNILQDRSYTNSIHKIYICAMRNVTQFKHGDIIVTYRTSDRNGQARFRSVMTSLCVIQEVLSIFDFRTLEEFLKYCEPYSIFSDNELREFYHTKKYPYIIKMTYNLAFKKRVTNGYLQDNIGLNPSYWGVFDISRQQFNKIIEAGEVDESLIIN